jgi:hypothetical protein
MQESMAKFDYRDNQKVNDLHTKLTNFSSCSTILELAFAANEVCAMLAMNGRYLHSRKALAGDVTHPQPKSTVHATEAVGRVEGELEGHLGVIGGLSTCGAEANLLQATHMK